MKISLKEISPELLDKVLDLESIMIPVLTQIGVFLTREDIKTELMKDPEQTIILAFKQSEIAALLRYSREEHHLFIKSIVLNPKIGVTALRRLIQEAIPVLKQESAEFIESVVQVSNPRSIAMHEKLGFHKIKENSKAIRYRISLEELILSFIQ